jgi:hypothetical protein
VEELAAAIWKLERTDRRMDRLDVEAGLEVAGEAVDFSCVQNPAPFQRALSMQTVAAREVMRITHLLLAANTRDGKRPLPG